MGLLLGVNYVFLYKTVSVFWRLLTQFSATEFRKSVYAIPRESMLALGQRSYTEKPRNE